MIWSSRPELFVWVNIFINNRVGCVVFIYYIYFIIYYLIDTTVCMFPLSQTHRYFILIFYLSSYFYMFLGKKEVIVKPCKGTRTTSEISYKKILTIIQEEIVVCLSLGSLWYTDMPLLLLHPPGNRSPMLSNASVSEPVCSSISYIQTSVIGLFEGNPRKIPPRGLAQIRCLWALV